MARLSITEAWNETADFARRDFGPLFAISLALIAFPSFALQALAPEVVTPGSASAPALWLLLGLVAIASIIAGSIAISSLALGRETIVGKAIGRGFRRMPMLFLASLIIGFAAILVLLALVVAIGIDPEALSAGNPEALQRFMGVFLLFLLLFLPFWVRLMLMTPAAASEGGGPISLIRRSWGLTQGHFWKLLGFTILIGILVLVVTLVVTTLVGLLITLVLGRPEPGNLANLIILLVSAVVNAAVTVFMTTMVARIYVQLSGGAGAAAAAASPPPAASGT